MESNKIIQVGNIFLSDIAEIRKGNMNVYDILKKYPELSNTDIIKCLNGNPNANKYMDYIRLIIEKKEKGLEVID